MAGGGIGGKDIPFQILFVDDKIEPEIRIRRSEKTLHILGHIPKHKKDIGNTTRHKRIDIPLHKPLCAYFKKTLRLLLALFFQTLANTRCQYYCSHDPTCYGC